MVLEVLEIVVLRFCAGCVRGRFRSLSDPSVSMTLFLDIAAFVVASFACMRCALVSAAIRLRSAASAAFCAC